MRNANILKAVACAIVVALVLTVAGLAFGQPAIPLDAVCRVQCGPGLVGNGGTSCGSGVLVDTTAKREGLIITNKHVVSDDSRGPFRVTFSDGSQHRATLVAVSKDYDLAALKIAEVDRQAARWGGAIKGERFYSAGFGGDGKIKYKWGSHTGHSTSGRQRNVYFTMPIQGGDSGGPAFNEQGEVVAICWGGDGNDPQYRGYYDDTVAVHGDCLVEFLGKLGLKPPAVPQQYVIESGCPGGQCPPYYYQQPYQIVPNQPDGGFYTPDPQPGDEPAPIADAPPQDGCDCEGEWKSIKERIAVLENTKPVPGPQGPQGPPGLPGADGKDGARGPAGEAPPVDLDKLAKLVAGELGQRKIRVIQQDYYTGETLDEGTVSLDGNGVLVLKYGVKREDARRD
jgi:hypothetical protein